MVFWLAEMSGGRGRWGNLFLMPRPPKTASEFSLSPSAVKLRLLKTLRCTLRYEKNAWASGAVMVAGVDEVGRGSLFGPVVAVEVIPLSRYSNWGVGGVD